MNIELLQQAIGEILSAKYGSTITVRVGNASKDKSTELAAGAKTN